MYYNKLMKLIYETKEDATYDFYRIEVLTNSEDHAELIKYLNHYDVDYVEDVKYGSSILIFKVPRGDKLIDRRSIVIRFGHIPYFAMEGNLMLDESELYKCYKEIQKDQDS